MEDMKANTASEDYHIVDTTSLMYVQVYGFLIYDLKNTSVILTTKICPVYLCWNRTFCTKLELQQFNLTSDHQILNKYSLNTSERLWMDRMENGERMDRSHWNTYLSHGLDEVGDFSLWFIRYCNLLKRFGQTLLALNFYLLLFGVYVSHKQSLCINDWHRQSIKSAEIRILRDAVYWSTVLSTHETSIMSPRKHNDITELHRIVFVPVIGYMCDTAIYISKKLANCPHLRNV